VTRPETRTGLEYARIAQWLFDASPFLTPVSRRLGTAPAGGPYCPIIGSASRLQATTPAYLSAIILASRFARSSVSTWRGSKLPPKPIGNGMTQNWTGRAGYGAGKGDNRQRPQFGECVWSSKELRRPFLMQPKISSSGRNTIRCRFIWGHYARGGSEFCEAGIGNRFSVGHLASLPL